ncbi:hypothetical protein PG991_012254 [Apiospora marii]|uniref:Uncharacterized protein n=1 Tax=Apiospora marii TaxID=335849 RepID=A0ABR1R9G0_9PEZI
MLRMANDTQWCTACQDWHPWIMFSQNERRSPSPLPSEWLKASSALWAHTQGGRCIMAEGSLSICPHHAVKLEGLGEWILSLGAYVPKKPYSPLLLNCDICFQELPQPFRSAAVPPSATFHPLPRDRRGVIGSAFVSWTLPLQLDTDTVLQGNWTALQPRAAGEEARSRGDAAKLESALARAGETYNDLLCPHARLDDLQTLRDFADHAEEVVSDFQRGHTWDVRLGKYGFSLNHSSGNGGAPMIGPFARMLELDVPALDRCSQFKTPYNVWRQLLNPEWYGLPEDTELRHITWCPDKQCANGKGWATHLHYLRVIAAHFTMRAGFPSDREGLKRYPLFDRQIDRDFMLRHENASMATSVPHVYRGLKFRPILPWRHPGERHRDTTLLALLW